MIHDLCLSYLPLIAVLVTLKLKRYYTDAKKPKGKEHDLPCHQRSSNV